MHSTMNKWIAGATLITVGVLTGCVDPTPRLDSKFGNAVNMAKAQQTINPDASLNTSPAVGLDGTAANAIMDRYHRTHEAPSPAPGAAIGTISSGGTTLK